MKRIVICLLVLFVANILQAAPVYIPDTNLKAAIEAKLGIPNPDANQMLLLTHLDANSLGISDLTGLETALNLKHLRADLNLITILSPLHGLTKLEYLNLNDNNITNISPLECLASIIISFQRQLFLPFHNDSTSIN
jgi:Leucine-rich repeat (LRR) protein